MIERGGENPVINDEWYKKDTHFFLRLQLYVQESQQETKELHLSEAKGTLISHPSLLAELEEWEESQTDHALLIGSQTSLVGRSVSVCNTQGVWPQWFSGIVTAHNQQTKVHAGRMS